MVRPWPACAALVKVLPLLPPLLLLPLLPPLLLLPLLLLPPLDPARLVDGACCRCCAVAVVPAAAVLHPRQS